MTKRQEAELQAAESKMLSFYFGVTRRDRIKNECVRGTAQIGHFGDKVRGARLRWFAHVQRTDHEDAGDGATRQEAKRKTKEEIYETYLFKDTYHISVFTQRSAT